MTRGRRPRQGTTTQQYCAAKQDSANSGQRRWRRTVRGAGRRLTGGTVAQDHIRPGRPRAAPENGRNAVVTCNTSGFAGLCPREVSQAAAAHAQSGNAPLLSA